MLDIRLFFSPLLIHIREEKYIYFFLLSDSCIKCMERRVLKHTATSVEMNKISDSFSGYRESERERYIYAKWITIYWHRVYTANPLCNIKTHWTGSKILYTIKSGWRLLCKRLPAGNQCICAFVRTASIKTGRFLSILLSINATAAWCPGGCRLSCAVM